MSNTDDVFAQYKRDENASAIGGKSFLVERRLAAALEAIGWRAASGVPASEVGAHLSMILSACADGHRDLLTLRGDIAECLHHYAHQLDGSAPHRSEWHPAAIRIIELYGEGNLCVTD